MGRTIPSFRIAAILEEKEWKLFRKYLNKKDDKKAFDDMFSTVRLYNSACSYAVNPIRIYPLMMSIVLHQYKILKQKNFVKSFSSNFNDINIDNKTSNNDTIILKEEMDKWNNFSSVLRKHNQELFNEMLQSSYKYSSAINVKGEQFSTESLIMSLLFEQYKIKS
ncbi:MAG: hypothetical protein ACM31H_02975 [Nitrososphaerales archaeon]